VTGTAGAPAAHSAARSRRCHPEARTSVEAAQEERAQRLEDEWQRQMAEDAGVDTTSTTLSAQELLCAESEGC
jgi:hypothetical protein